MLIEQVTCLNNLHDILSLPTRESLPESLSDVPSTPPPSSGTEFSLQTFMKALKGLKIHGISIDAIAPQSKLRGYTLVSYALLRNNLPAVQALVKLGASLDVPHSETFQHPLLAFLLQPQIIENDPFTPAHLTTLQWLCENNDLSAVPEFAAETFLKRCSQFPFTHTHCSMFIQLVMTLRCKRSTLITLASAATTGFFSKIFDLYPCHYDIPPHIDLGYDDSSTIDLNESIPISQQQTYTLTTNAPTNVVVKNQPELEAVTGTPSGYIESRTPFYRLAEFLIALDLSTTFYLPLSICLYQTHNLIYSSYTDITSSGSLSGSDLHQHQPESGVSTNTTVFQDSRQLPSSLPLNNSLVSTSSSTRGLMNALANENISIYPITSPIDITSPESNEMMNRPFLPQYPIPASYFQGNGFDLNFYQTTIEPSLAYIHNLITEHNYVMSYKHFDLAAFWYYRRLVYEVSFRQPSYLSIKYVLLISKPFHTHKLFGATQQHQSNLDQIQLAESRFSFQRQPVDPLLWWYETTIAQDIIADTPFPDGRATNIEGAPMPLISHDRPLGQLVHERLAEQHATETNNDDQSLNIPAPNTHNDTEHETGIEVEEPKYQAIAPKYNPGSDTPSDTPYQPHIPSALSRSLLHSRNQAIPLTPLDLSSIRKDEPSATFASGTPNISTFGKAQQEQPHRCEIASINFIAQLYQGTFPHTNITLALARLFIAYGFRIRLIKTIEDLLLPTHSINSPLSLLNCSRNKNATIYSVNSNNLPPIQLLHQHCPVRVFGHYDPNFGAGGPKGPSVDTILNLSLPTNHSFPDSDLSTPLSTRQFDPIIVNAPNHCPLSTDLICVPLINKTNPLVVWPRVKPELFCNSQTTIAPFTFSTQRSIYGETEDPMIQFMNSGQSQVQPVGGDNNDSYVTQLPEQSVYNLQPRPSAVALPPALQSKRQSSPDSVTVPVLPLPGNATSTAFSPPQPANRPTSTTPPDSTAQCGIFSTIAGYEIDPYSIDSLHLCIYDNLLFSTKAFVTATLVAGSTNGASVATKNALHSFYKRLFPAVFESPNLSISLKLHFLYNLYLVSHYFAALAGGAGLSHYITRDSFELLPFESSQSSLYAAGPDALDQPPHLQSNPPPSPDIDIEMVANNFTQGSEMSMGPGEYAKLQLHAQRNNTVTASELKSQINPVLFEVFSPIFQRFGYPQQTRPGQPSKPSLPVMSKAILVDNGNDAETKKRIQASVIAASFPSTSSLNSTPALSRTTSTTSTTSTATTATTTNEPIQLHSKHDYYKDYITWNGQYVQTIQLHQGDLISTQPTLIAVCSQIIQSFNNLLTVNPSHIFHIMMCYAIIDSLLSTPLPCGIPELHPDQFQRIYADKTNPYLPPPSPADARKFYFDFIPKLFKKSSPYIGARRECSRIITLCRRLFINPTADVYLDGNGIDMLRSMVRGGISMRQSHLHQQPFPTLLQNQPYPANIKLTSQLLQPLGVIHTFPTLFVRYTNAPPADRYMNLNELFLAITQISDNGMLLMLLAQVLVELRVTPSDIPSFVHFFLHSTLEQIQSVKFTSFQLLSFHIERIFSCVILVMNAYRVYKMHTIHTLISTLYQQWAPCYEEAERLSSLQTPLDREEANDLVRYGRARYDEQQFLKHHFQSNTHHLDTSVLSANIALPPDTDDTADDSTPMSIFTSMGMGPIDDANAPEPAPEPKPIVYQLPSGTLLDPKDCPDSEIGGPLYPYHIYGMAPQGLNAGAQPTTVFHQLPQFASHTQQAPPTSQQSSQMSTPAQTFNLPSTNPSRQPIQLHELRRLVTKVFPEQLLAIEKKLIETTDAFPIIGVSPRLLDLWLVTFSPIFDCPRFSSLYSLLDQNVPLPESVIAQDLDDADDDDDDDDILPSSPVGNPSASDPNLDSISGDDDSNNGQLNRNQQRSTASPGPGASSLIHGLSFLPPTLVPAISETTTNVTSNISIGLNSRSSHHTTSKKRRTLPQPKPQAEHPLVVLFVQHFTKQAQYRSVLEAKSRMSTKGTPTLSSSSPRGSFTAGGSRGSFSGGPPPLNINSSPLGPGAAKVHVLADSTHSSHAGVVTMDDIAPLELPPSTTNSAKSQSGFFAQGQSPPVANPRHPSSSATVGSSSRATVFNVNQSNTTCDGSLTPNVNPSTTPNVPIQPLVSNFVDPLSSTPKISRNPSFGSSSQPDAIVTIAPLNLGPFQGEPATLDQQSSQVATSLDHINIQLFDSLPIGLTTEFYSTSSPWIGIFASIQSRAIPFYKIIFSLPFTPSLNDILTIPFPPPNQKENVPVVNQSALPQHDNSLVSPSVVGSSIGDMAAGGHLKLPQSPTGTPHFGSRPAPGSISRASPAGTPVFGPTGSQSDLTTNAKPPQPQQSTAEPVTSLSLFEWARADTLVDAAPYLATSDPRFCQRAELYPYLTRDNLFTDPDKCISLRILPAHNLLMKTEHFWPLALFLLKCRLVYITWIYEEYVNAATLLKFDLDVDDISTIFPSTQLTSPPLPSMGAPSSIAPTSSPNLDLTKLKLKLLTPLFNRSTPSSLLSTIITSDDSITNYYKMLSLINPIEDSKFSFSAFFQYNPYTSLFSPNFNTYIPTSYHTTMLNQYPGIVDHITDTMPSHIAALFRSGGQKSCADYLYCKVALYMFRWFSTTRPKERHPILSLISDESLNTKVMNTTIWAKYWNYKLDTLTEFDHQPVHSHFRTPSYSSGNQLSLTPSANNLSAQTTLASATSTHSFMTSPPSQNSAEMDLMDETLRFHLHTIATDVTTEFIYTVESQIAQHFYGALNTSYLDIFTQLPWHFNYPMDVVMDFYTGLNETHCVSSLYRGLQGQHQQQSQLSFGSPIPPGQNQVYQSSMASRNITAVSSFKPTISSSAVRSNFEKWAHFRAFVMIPVAAAWFSTAFTHGERGVQFSFSADPKDLEFEGRVSAFVPTRYDSHNYSNIFTKWYNSAMNNAKYALIAKFFTNETADSDDASPGAQITQGRRAVAPGAIPGFAGAGAPVVFPPGVGVLPGMPAVLRPGVVPPPGTAAGAVPIRRPGIPLGLNTGGRGLGGGPPTLEDFNGPQPSKINLLMESIPQDIRRGFDFAVNYPTLQLINSSWLHIQLLASFYSCPGANRWSRFFWQSRELNLNPVHLAFDRNRMLSKEDSHMTLTFLKLTTQSYVNPNIIPYLSTTTISGQSIRQSSLLSPMTPGGCNSLNIGSVNQVQVSSSGSARGTPVLGSVAGLPPPQLLTLPPAAVQQSNDSPKLTGISGSGVGSGPRTTSTKISSLTLTSTGPNSAQTSANPSPLQPLPSPNLIDPQSIQLQLHRTNVDIKSPWNTTWFRENATQWFEQIELSTDMVSNHLSFKNWSQRALEQVQDVEKFLDDEFLYQYLCKIFEKELHSSPFQNENHLNDLDSDNTSNIDTEQLHPTAIPTAKQRLKVITQRLKKLIPTQDSIDFGHNFIKAVAKDQYTTHHIRSRPHIDDEMKRIDHFEVDFDDAPEIPTQSSPDDKPDTDHADAGEQAQSLANAPDNGITAPLNLQFNKVLFTSLGLIGPSFPVPQRPNSFSLLSSHQENSNGHHLDEPHESPVLNFDPFGPYSTTVHRIYPNAFDATPLLRLPPFSTVNTRTDFLKLAKDYEQLQRPEMKVFGSNLNAYGEKTSRRIAKLQAGNFFRNTPLGTLFSQIIPSESLQEIVDSLLSSGIVDVRQLGWESYSDSSVSHLLSTDLYENIRPLYEHHTIIPGELSVNVIQSSSGSQNLDQNGNPLSQPFGPSLNVLVDTHCAFRKDPISNVLVHSGGVTATRHFCTPRDVLFEAISAFFCIPLRAPLMPTTGGSYTNYFSGGQNNPVPDDQHHEALVTVRVAELTPSYYWSFSYYITSALEIIKTLFAFSKKVSFKFDIISALVHLISFSVLPISNFKMVELIHFLLEQHQRQSAQVASELTMVMTYNNALQNPKFAHATILAKTVVLKALNKPDTATQLPPTAVRIVQQFDQIKTLYGNYFHFHIHSNTLDNIQSIPTSLLTRLFSTHLYSARHRVPVSILPSLIPLPPGGVPPGTTLTNSFLLSGPPHPTGPTVNQQQILQQRQQQSSMSTCSSSTNAYVLKPFPTGSFAVLAGAQPNLTTTTEGIHFNAQPSPTAAAGSTSGQFGSSRTPLQNVSIQAAFGVPNLGPPSPSRIVHSYAPVGSSSRALGVEYGTPSPPRPPLSRPSSSSNQRSAGSARGAPGVFPSRLAIAMNPPGAPTTPTNAQSSRSFGNSTDFTEKVTPRPETVSAAGQVNQQQQHFSSPSGYTSSSLMSLRTRLALVSPPKLHSNSLLNLVKKLTTRMSFSFNSYPHIGSPDYDNMINLQRLAMHVNYGEWRRSHSQMPTFSVDFASFDPRKFNLTPPANEWGDIDPNDDKPPRIERPEDPLFPIIGAGSLTPTPSPLLQAIYSIISSNYIPVPALAPKVRENTPLSTDNPQTIPTFLFLPKILHYSTRLHIYRQTLNRASFLILSHLFSLGFAPDASLYPSNPVNKRGTIDHYHESMILSQFKRYARSTHITQFSNPSTVNYDIAFSTAMSKGLEQMCFTSIHSIGHREWARNQGPSHTHTKPEESLTTTATVSTSAQSSPNLSKRTDSFLNALTSTILFYQLFSSPGLSAIYANTQKYPTITALLLRFSPEVASATFPFLSLSQVECDDSLPLNEVDMTHLENLELKENELSSQHDEPDPTPVLQLLPNIDHQSDNASPLIETDSDSPTPVGSPKNGGNGVISKQQTHHASKLRLKQLKWLQKHLPDFPQFSTMSISKDPSPTLSGNATLPPLNLLTIHNTLLMMQFNDYCEFTNDPKFPSPINWDQVLDIFAFQLKYLREIGSHRYEQVILDEKLSTGMNAAMQTILHDGDLDKVQWYEEGQLETKPEDTSPVTHGQTLQTHSSLTLFALNNVSDIDLDDFYALITCTHSELTYKPVQLNEHNSFVFAPNNIVNFSSDPKLPQPTSLLNYHFETNTPVLVLHSLLMHNLPDKYLEFIFNKLDQNDMYQIATQQYLIPLTSYTPGDTLDPFGLKEWVVNNNTHLWKESKTSGIDISSATTTKALIDQDEQQYCIINIFSFIFHTLYPPSLDVIKKYYDQSFREFDHDTLDHQSQITPVVTPDLSGKHSTIHTVAGNQPTSQSHSNSLTRQHRHITLPLNQIEYFRQYHSTLGALLNVIDNSPQ